MNNLTRKYYEAEDRQGGGEKKPLRLEYFPHLVELKKQVEAIRFGTTEYWKERATYLEKSLDPTYSEFERRNCALFHTILVKKNI